MKNLLENIIQERSFNTYFVQVIIKLNKDYNFTEIYNQIRGVKDVVVVKIVDNDRLDSISTKDHKYSLLEMKFLSGGNPIDTIKEIKHESLKIEGLVKFYIRVNTLLKIRNY